MGQPLTRRPNFVHNHTFHTNIQLYRKEGKKKRKLYQTNLKGKLNKRQESGKGWAQGDEVTKQPQLRLILFYHLFTASRTLSERFIAFYL